MMKHLFAAAALVALPAMSQAQEIDLSVDFTELNRSAFVSEMRAMGEASWAPMMSLYGRLDPSLAALVPEFPWSSEFEAAYGCVYDGMTARDAMNDMNEMRDKTAQLVEYIGSSDQVTFASLAEDDVLLDLMLPSDNLVEVNRACGLQELSMKALTESGLMEAFMAKMMEDG